MPAKVTDEERAELENLRAENKALREKSEKSATLSLKVSQKGAVSLYGMGRFPVTLYAEQWVKVIAFSDTITKFIDDNRNELNFKNETKVPV